MRWLVSNRRNVPSGDQATLLALPLARKLAWRGSPPAAATIATLVKPRVPEVKNASHLPSGDHASGRPTCSGSAISPFASDRSFFVSTSSTRSSVPPRTNAIAFPSGEKRGA